MGKASRIFEDAYLEFWIKGADDSNFLNKICNTGAFCLPFKLFDNLIYALVVATCKYFS